MAWLSLLNPMNWIKLLSLVKFFVEGIAKVIAAFKESAAKKTDKSNAEKAIEEMKKPLDPTKSVEQRQKEEEDKFDDFFNSNNK